MMISHDGQKSKGDSETLISFTPLKTALGPKRTQYRFQPQLQLFTKTYIRISLSLGPPHLLARLSRLFYDCGIALTCLTLPNYLPAVWLGAAVSAGLSFWWPSDSPTQNQQRCVFTPEIDIKLQYPLVENSLSLSYTAADKFGPGRRGSNLTITFIPWCQILRIYGYEKIERDWDLVGWVQFNPLRNGSKDLLFPSNSIIYFVSSYIKMAFFNIQFIFSKKINTLYREKNV